MWFLVHYRKHWMTVLVKQNKKWIYKGDVVPDDIPQNHGFVYKIEYTDGTYYYGR